MPDFGETSGIFYLNRCKINSQVRRFYIMHIKESYLKIKAEVVDFLCAALESN